MINQQYDLSKLRANGITVKEMIETISGSDGEIFLENMKKYQPNMVILNQLEKKAKGFSFVVFSADWCKDCKKNVAEFAKLLELKPTIDSIFFKGIKTAPLDPNVRWKVPPSPPEVNEFDVRKLPTFFILNASGRVVSQMIENPIHKSTLEEELLYLLETL